MGYSDLYAYCQGLLPPIGRNVIRDKVLELTGVPKIPWIRAEMDTTLYRGFYLCGDNADAVPFSEDRVASLLRQFGGRVVVVARGLSRSWERIVLVKEFMHLFDKPGQMTAPEQLEGLLSDIMTGSTDPSPQFGSEIIAFWMAMGVLCPEPTRQQLLQERRGKTGDAEDLAISLKLRIPEQYVPLLFEQDYENRLKKIIEHNA